MLGLNAGVGTLVTGMQCKPDAPFTCFLFQLLTGSTDRAQMCSAENGFIFPVHERFCRTVFFMTQIRLRYRSPIELLAGEMRSFKGCCR